MHEAFPAQVHMSHVLHNFALFADVGPLSS
ncbi:hypothetical protein AGR7B_Lc70038 [Agrobacterium deltaense RV3]|nr:hypothetical protein AGR7B_Lc70038 [Agrobacterium deltaense RV3]